jgi:PAS domain S-box-containing protein
LAAAALARRFTRPIDKLTQRVRALQRGDFDSPVPREGPAELRLFAASFEHMARSLRESEMRNQAVLHNALDAVVGMDAEGRVSDWNAQAEAIFGWKRAEALGQPMHTLIIPPRHREGHVRGLERFLSSGEQTVLNRRIEITALRRSGEEFPVELTVTPLWAGDTHFFYAFVRDLSEVKRVQAERSRLERWSMTVNNNATSALFLMDARQHCTYMNPAAEKMTGFTLAEVQGRPLHEFIHYLHPDGRPYPIQDCPIDRALPQKNQERGEDVFIHKDGSFYNVAFSASPILEEGAPVGTVIEVRDISEEKRQQREREHAQERQRFLVEASNLLAESLDFEDTLSKVAHLAVPRVADLCSVRILETDGSLPPLAVAYASSDKEAWVEELLRDLAPDPKLAFGAAETLRTGAPQLIPEVSEPVRQALIRAYPALEPAVKELGLVSVMSVPMRAAGRQLGVISLVATNASKRRFDQADLAFAEEFARRCAAAVENARLFKQVQEGVRLRDEFLSIASHELKTPLTPLQLQVQTILRRAAQLTRDDEARQWLEQRLATLQRQGERLNRLVDELLDISRLARGRLQLNLEAVELAEVVDEVVTTLQTQGEMERRGAQVSVSIEAGIVGRWDRLRLEQVIINLLTNALKYGEGSPVAIAGRAQEGEAILTVADKGIGISEAYQQRIFERFERAASATHYGGLGLGLYIVQQVISALGGTIGVQSSPGQGATFTVTLPLGGPAAVLEAGRGSTQEGAERL